MNVLVIGSNGYIGSAVVRCLLAHAHTVTALRRATAHPAQIGPGAEPEGLTHMEGDLLLPDTWRAALQACDAVVIAADTGSAQLNHQGVRAAIAALAGSGKALVWTSSTAVFASAPEGARSEESYGEDDARYLHPGSDERVAIEHTVLEAGEQGVRGIVIRSPLVYGRSGGQYLAAMVNQARATGAVNYVGTGQNRQSYVHVDDLAQAYLLALLSAPAGSVFHAVAGEARMRDIAGAIAATHGAVARSATLPELAMRVGLAPAAANACNCRARIGRLQLLLGWQPVQLDLMTILQRRPEWTHVQLNALAAHSRHLAGLLKKKVAHARAISATQGPATVRALFPAIDLLHSLPRTWDKLPARVPTRNLFYWETS